MNVGAINIVSTAMEGLDKAQKTVSEAAQTIASGNSQISARSQIAASAGANLTDALISLMTAKIGFEANAEMIKTSDAMVTTLIDSI
jgi:flagellar hook protein FlgE